MGSYDEFLERSRTGCFCEDDPDFHFHTEDKERCRRICLRLLDPELTDDDKNELFERLFGYRMPEKTFITAPFNCDVGKNIRLGKHDFFNYGCSISDVGLVTFGDNVMLGPGVRIIAVDHPREAEKRRQG
jgi:maltose O-acetyltransferase